MATAFFCCAELSLGDFQLKLKKKNRFKIKALKVTAEISFHLSGEDVSCTVVFIYFRASRL